MGLVLFAFVQPGMHPLRLNRRVVTTVFLFVVGLIFVDSKAANVGLVAIMEKASAGEWSFYKEVGNYSPDRVSYWGSYFKYRKRCMCALGSLGAGAAAGCGCRVPLLCALGSLGAGGAAVCRCCVPLLCAAVHGCGLKKHVPA